MKTRTPIVPADVKVLAPEHMTPSAPGEAVGNGRKRRNQNSESNSGACSAKDSLPMEQRLSALNLDVTVDAVAPPQADNMAQLLLQVGPHFLSCFVLKSFDCMVIRSTGTA